jgi:hypothetical protein
MVLTTEAYDKLVKDSEYLGTLDLDQLFEDSQFLAALHAAGVDNWDGYDEAQNIVEQWDE